MYNYIPWKMIVVCGLGEEVIGSQKHVSHSEKNDCMQDVQFPSALCPWRAQRLKVEKSLVFTGACLASFLLFLRLITLSEWFPRFAAFSRYI